MATESKDDDDGTAAQAPEPDAVGELIRMAGRREQPPAEDYQLVLGAATGAWRATVARRQRRRLGYGIAAAGGLAAALVVALVIQLSPPPVPMQLASVYRVLGTVSARGPDSAEWQVLSAGAPALMSSTEIRTEPGSRIGLVLSNGVSVRIDESTQLALASLSEIRLENGAVYVDSGADQSTNRQVEVITRAGSTRDIGTQFEVRYAENRLRVRVREGRVVVQRGTELLHGSSGEQVVVGPSHYLVRTRIARYDPVWQWVEDVAPTPELYNRPASALLEWVARETGREIQFAGPEVQARADTAILRGSGVKTVQEQNLPPMEVLEAVMPTTDLEYEILDSGDILIQARGQASKT